MKARDEAGIVAQRLLQIGPVAQDLQCRAQQFGGGFLTGAEQEGGSSHDLDDLGRGSVRVLRCRQIAQHIVARLTTPVFDVEAELLVEKLQRIGRGGIVLEVAHGVRITEHRPEFVVIGFGHTEQVGDGKQRVGLGIRLQELAFAALDELVKLLVGQTQQEVLVLFEARGRQQPAQHRSGPGVVRRIHRHHVLVQRQSCAVLLDQAADVVAGRLERQRREGPPTAMQLEYESTFLYSAMASS